MQLASHTLRETAEVNAPHRYCLCTAVTNCGRNLSCITAWRQGMTPGRMENPQMLNRLALDRFYWLVVGVTLACAALVVCLYW